MSFPVLWLSSLMEGAPLLSTGTDGANNTPGGMIIAIPSEQPITPPLLKGSVILNPAISVIPSMPLKGAPVLQPNSIGQQYTVGGYHEKLGAGDPVPGFKLNLGNRLMVLNDQKITALPPSSS